MAAILRVSVMPPEWDGSGWMMSTAPLATTCLKSQREYSRSPSAIGVAALRRTSSTASTCSLSTGSSMNISL